MVRRTLLVMMLALAGCVGPSVPIPPPQPEAMIFNLNTETGEATFRANAQQGWERARISVYNIDAGEGVITLANNDGSVSETRPFSGLDGDRIFVTYEAENQSSGTCLFLHQGASSQANRC